MRSEFQMTAGERQFCLRVYDTITLLDILGISSRLPETSKCGLQCYKQIYTLCNSTVTKRA